MATTAERYINRPAFATDRLESLMAEAGLDLLLVNSRANLLYLTGGRFHHMFRRSTHMGDYQYVPLLGLPAGGLDRAFHVARSDEAAMLDSVASWVPETIAGAMGGVSAARVAAERVRRLGLDGARIGIETEYLPTDAYLTLRDELPRATLVDALPLLLELRAVKRPEELERLTASATLVASAIDAVYPEAAEIGATTEWVHARMAREIEARGGAFAYALISVGSELERYPRARDWRQGEMMQIDSGCDLDGYRCDVARMAVRGEPTPLMRELYEACGHVHDAVKANVRAGMTRGEMAAVMRDAIAAEPHAAYGRYELHGIGLNHHEEPLFEHPDRALVAGNVVSVEAYFVHPETGSVKLEDAIAITETGCVYLGAPFGALRALA